MAYENDIIMRQVRDMTRMLAKILFGKNTATYEYKEEDRHTATDSLYARLIALVDAGVGVREHYCHAVGEERSHCRNRIVAG